MAHKVFILGIDGATFDVILPMVEQGRLPNLARLLQEGAWGPLRSTIHPITPAAWCSFATGKNPGKHGVYDFTAPNRETYGFKLNSARDRRADSFWGILGRAGRKVIVVNVPFTFPPERVNGILISGFDSPGADRSMAHPAEVYDDLVGRFGSYTPDWSFPAGKRYDPEKYRQDVAAVIQRRGEATVYLMEKYPWDLFMTVFQSIDHIQHVFFGLDEWGLEFIRQGYERVDEALGEVLRRLDGDTTLMVVSDHGAGPIRKVFFLDQWLEKEGFLVPRKGAWLQRLGRETGRRGRRLGKKLLPVSARGYLRGRFPELRNKVVSYSAGAPADWSRTRAYSGGMYGNVFLNLKGREAEGIVEEGEYRAVCEAIRTRLLTLVDPDSGEKAVEAVHLRDEVYDGPFVSGAPDLLIRWRDYAYFTKKGIDRKGMIFSDDLTLDSSSFPHSGTHRINGVFAAWGPGIRGATRLQDLRIEDVAPGVMYLMGNPIPDDLDGKLRQEMFDPDLLQRSRPQYVHADPGSRPGADAGGTAPGEEDEELRQRLRSLGYIE